MGFLQSDLLLVAHQPLEEVSSESATGKELRVSAAVRHAGESSGRVVDHLCHEFRVEPAVRTEELDLEAAGHRQVKHDVDRVLALFLSDLAERLADVLF